MPLSDCIGEFACFWWDIDSGKKKGRTEMNRYSLNPPRNYVLLEFINSDQELIDTQFLPRLIVLNLNHFPEAILISPDPKHSNS